MGGAIGGAATAFPCDYVNRAAKVCHVPAAIRDRAPVAHFHNPTITETEMNLPERTMYASPHASDP